MFRRSVSLKSARGLVVRVKMASNKQGGFPNPNAKPYDGNRERHMEASESFPRYEASKDNGVQGDQFSNDGSHQNDENTPRPPGSYPHDEMRGSSRSTYPHETRGNYRSRGRGHRNYDRDVQPGPYQSDSPKDNRNRGHGQLAQSGPNQGDSEKGDMAQRNSVKSGMDQGYRQEAKPDSYQATSQEGRGVVQDHGQGAEPISYQYPHERRGNYRGRGRGHRNYHRDGSQQSHYYEDPKKADNDQSVQPGPYQSDSPKDNRNQGHGWPAQSGPNQGDSQKGDMAQSNSVKSGMDQGYRQEAKPDSYQACSQEGKEACSQEGKGGVRDHGQGAEPIYHQGHSQENIDRGQHNENDSRQGLQAVFDQKDTQKGTKGDRAQGLEQRIEPDSYKGDVSKIQPIFDQNVSQKGKEGDHVQGAQPSCNKGNLKEGNDMGQSHGNDSIQTQSASHQKDLQKSNNRGQSHEKDSGQGNKFGPNQERWRKGENSSRGHYQDNKSHSYQEQERSYSRQASSGGGSRRDNFDQQQRKRNRAGDEDDIFLSKTLSFLLRHGAEKQNFKLMPGGFLYVDEILKKMRKLEGYTVEDVQRIVAQNDKQRFAIQKEDGTGRLKIRANQGHTVEVENLELTPITSADQVPVVLHGTYWDAWNSIKKQGLCRFKRNHIHFAAGEPGENGVISGMRSSCEVLIYIDLEKALKDGLKFYLSANRVILSPGNEEGYIYPCYFSAVLNRYPYHILEFNPNIKGKTVSADQTSNELDKKTKKKNKKKKKNKDRENNESKAPGEEVEGVGDTNLFADEGEKLKEENIEGKDEEDQFVDAMDTEPEKLTQIEVPDAWDAVEKVELDWKALINSKGAEQSEGTQGLAESEDIKETKESKTNEKESWSETSKRASKSEAQSRSQAPKGATKPENPKGSVIQEGEQKAIKKGTFVPGDEDEEAPNGATEDEEDVKIEEEWTTVSITSVEESQSAVEYILEHKQNEPVSIICCGEKQGDADGKITLLVISMQNKSWIYQLCNMKPDLLDTGKLKQLFFDTDLMKVFHDVTWQSAVLFKQYEIVLDGTKVFDSKVVCHMKLLDDKTIDILRLEGFMPSRWVEEDGKIESSKWTEISLDQELINKLVERCKALLQFYKMFTMQKVPQPRKQIYVEVNKYVDKKSSQIIRKNFKSQAEKPPPKPTSSSKEQRKVPASPKKGKKNKGK